MHLNQIVVALGACVLVSAAPTTSPFEYGAKPEKRPSPVYFRLVMRRNFSRHVQQNSQFQQRSLVSFSSILRMLGNSFRHDNHSAIERCYHRYSGSRRNPRLASQSLIRL